MNSREGKILESGSHIKCYSWMLILVCGLKNIHFRGIIVKKVEIISMQNVDNYGSVLQAYALKKMIEELGHKVFFEDIEPGKNIALNQQCAEGDISQKEITSPKTRNFLMRNIRRVKNAIEWRRFIRIFNEFRCQNGIVAAERGEKADICVIGSDEVFNCMQKCKWGFSTQLFGNVKNAKKVITYAACCGFTKPEMLSNELKTEIVKAMQHLSAISVRDENTARFVRELTNQAFTLNLDPVAVGDFDLEVQKTQLKGKLPSKYCIVYSYNNRIQSIREIEAIKKYCEKLGLKLIAPFGRQEWIPSSSTLTPFELLKAFTEAECIVTDTFHGALFGAKFGKHMAVIIRDSNRNKLADLTQRLHIENHVVEDMDKLSKVLCLNINRSEIETVLSRERARSLKYLRENLS